MTINDIVKIWRGVLTNTYITNLKGTKEYFDGTIHQLKRSDVDLSMEVVELDYSDNCLFISVNEEI